jgi:hypothetical protein
MKHFLLIISLKFVSTQTSTQILAEAQAANQGLVNKNKLLQGFTPINRAVLGVNSLVPITIPVGGGLSDFGLNNISPSVLTGNNRLATTPSLGTVGADKAGVLSGNLIAPLTSSNTGLTSPGLSTSALTGSQVQPLPATSPGGTTPAASLITSLNTLPVAAQKAVIPINPGTPVPNNLTAVTSNVLIDPLLNKTPKLALDNNTLGKSLVDINNSRMSNNDNNNINNQIKNVGSNYLSHANWSCSILLIILAISSYI